MRVCNQVHTLVICNVVRQVQVITSAGFIVSPSTYCPNGRQMCGCSKTSLRSQADKKEVTGGQTATKPLSQVLTVE